MSETTFTADKLEKMMRQIASLLERADHAATPKPEADACRAKAEELLKKYRIEESALGERGGVFAIKPIAKWVSVGDAYGEFVMNYATIAHIIAEHTECRYQWTYRRDPQTLEMSSSFHVFGFESDVRYFEMLVQSARLVFADRMEPKPIAGLSDQENVYRMRSAGIERIRISREMGWGDKTGRVTPLYVAECEKRGEDAPLVGKGLNVKVYREGYGQAFIETLHDRLMRARDIGNSDNAYALVLGNRKEAVTELMYQTYPHLRPDPNAVTNYSSSRRRGRAPRAKTVSAQNYATAMAGRSAGADAARAVDLGRGGTRVES